MKKIFITFLTAVYLVAVSTNTVSANDLGFVKEKLEVYEYVEEINELTKNWNDVTISNPVDLYSINNDKIGHLYKIFDSNIEKGYIIYLDEIGVAKVSFNSNADIEGIEGLVYYIFPSLFVDFYTAIEITSHKFINDYYTSGIGSFYEEGYYFEDNIIKYGLLERQRTYYINTNHIPNLSTNTTYSSQVYSSYKYINNVPDYLNEHRHNGCVPTASAMIIAYLDNEWEDEISSFDIGDYPMSAESNFWGSYTNEADDLIDELYDRFDSTFFGTTIPNFSMGFNEYLESVNFGDYKVYLSPVNDGNDTTTNEYYDYKLLINYGNPSVLFVGAEQYGGLHAVAGVGYITSSIIGNGFVVQDDLEHGISFITDDYVMYFAFLYQE
jgi:hypothetical protein